MPWSADMRAWHRLLNREPTMRKKPATLLVTIFLLLVAIAHLGRLVLRVEVTADGIIVPMWLSVIAVIVPPLLALGVWREGRE